ncbi:MAG TPA: ABC transporter ATP-binding protein [Rikenellaceae bacterium]|nr:MAG: ABC transporter ATP-binding protein [Bacteroidetes bacterium GWE2_40_15]HBZ24618.1 ABC transporter ATP-binding protein [Rikenellaceae bacterium]
MKTFKFFSQIDATDCGPAALRMVANYYGRHYNMESLRERCEKGRVGVNLLGISKAAEGIGLRTLGARLSFDELRKATLPAIVHWNQNHFVVLYEVKGKGDKIKMLIADPSTGLVKLSPEEFKKSWFSTVLNGEGRGIALFLEPTPKFYEEPGDKIDPKGFRFLLSYLKPHKKLIIQLIIGLLAGSIIQLIFPFLTQSIVDIGIGTRDIGFIWLILLAQLMLTISSALVDFIRGWILLHLGTRINISLISDFLSKLMRLPIGFFDTRMTGDLLQRIGDHKRIQSFLTGSSLTVLFSMVNILIFGVVLLYYSVTIFLVFLFASLIYVGWVLLFMRKRRELDNRTFTQNAANQSSIIQLIAGMQEIKLNSCEEQKRWEWEHIQARLFKLNIKGLALGQYQEAGGTLINQLKNILITVLAASSVISGELTLGMMLSVQYIIGQLNAPISNVIGFIRNSQDAKMSLERLAEVHEKNDEESPDQSLLSDIPTSKPINLDNLSFRYEGAGSPFVLKKINITIPPGKITAIVGMSGSGKTTLIKLLLGFYKPVSGDISYGDHRLSSISMSKWRQRCGVVMQDGYIFSDTIARNIAPGDENIDKERLIKAVETAKIREFVESLPLSYNTKIGQDGLGLSQGQKQRILIARAVYKDPEFIIFDEATNALDAKNERDIMKNLDEFFKGRTVVVVAHRLSTVKNADNIIVLDRGMMIEQGTHKELVANGSVYYELVKNQLYV